MNGKDDKPKGIAGLRWRAEEIAQGQGALSPKELTLMSREEMLKLVHELRVHQIELKMQNEELVRAQSDLTATRERYFDLCNLAPVGYFVVSREGRILETNSTGAILLGLPRAALIKQPITKTGQALTCELRMVKADGAAFWVRLTATTQAPAGTDGAPVSRVVLSDISEQKQMERDNAMLDARLQQTELQGAETASPRGEKVAKAAEIGERPPEAESCGVPFMACAAKNPSPYSRFRAVK